jgi:hypothetical protein
MKTATLIMFQLPRSTKKIAMADACKLYRALYGYNNSSCYGRYHTRVEGLIDQLKGIRLFKSAFIVQTKDVDQVLELLEKHNAEIVQRKVVLEKEDLTKLGIS